MSIDMEIERATPRAQQGRGCTNADPVIVVRMKAMTSSVTNETVYRSLGISYNTWRKLVAGEPVRASLLERLSHRLDALERIEAGSGG